jgi:PLP dependent protein
MKTLDQVTIVCASKYFDVEEIKELLHKGYNHFGENRVDSFLSKYESIIENNIHWHFIGHLQTNKAQKVIPYLDYLHTLDSLKLASIIQKYRETPLKCFIQVNLTEETQKDGITPEELDVFIKNIVNYDKIELVGLMTMGKLDDMQITRDAFKKLEKLRIQYGLAYTSMGMSDDYHIALEENASHIRLGRFFKSLLKE